MPSRWDVSGINSHDQAFKELLSTRPWLMTLLPMWQNEPKQLVLPQDHKARYLRREGDPVGTRAVDVVNERVLGLQQALDGLREATVR